MNGSVQGNSINLNSKRPQGKCVKAFHLRHVAGAWVACTVGTNHRAKGQRVQRNVKGAQQSDMLGIARAMQEM